MNINRNTYEEFFLLYVDNELSPADRREVEAFVELNPDLHEELEMLKEVVLRPENDSSFNKEILFRHNFPVTESNYEEYFVLYGDDELSREQKEYVEQFVYRHPEHQAEFEQILRAKLQADNLIVHPDKQSLYRHEKERRIVYMQWWKIAVAAILLLFMGGFGWYFTTHNQNSKAPLVTVPKSNTAPSAPAQSPERNQPELAVNQEKELNHSQTAGDQQPKAKPAKANTISSAEIAQVSKKSSDRSNISSSSIVKQESNQMPSVDTREVTEPKVELIASNVQDKPLVIDEALSEEQIRGVASKPENIETSIEEDNNVVYVANTTISKKNKFRGVFRKASRIFEKATNIDPTEGDRSVRIAGFEIALK